jgi:hypothetical protein
MKVEIDRQDPIQLTKYRKIIVHRNDLAAIVEKRPGLYFFSRRFGNAFKPFYIGKTKSIRGRLISHWGSRKIHFVLRGIIDDDVAEIKGGERYFHYGYFNKNVDPTKYLDIAEKYLIRFAMENGCTLINSNLTKIKVHNIEFNGSKNALAIYPKSAEIEVQRKTKLS